MLSKNLTPVIDNVDTPTCPHCGHALSEGELSHLWQAHRSRGGHHAAKVVDTHARAVKAAKARWAKEKGKQ